MWILSQDKKTLAKVERLAVQGKMIQNLPPTMFEDDYDILGGYESPERAIEVLNDIAETIKFVSESFIYKMPKK